MKDTVFLQVTASTSNAATIVPFSAQAFEHFARVCMLQVMSLAFFLVTYLHKTQGTVLKETNGGLS